MTNVELILLVWQFGQLFRLQFFALNFTCVVLQTVRKQCQGVTLVPIYRHPSEKFVIRDTYTHAGAKEECEIHNLTLAKEAQSTHRITDCINWFGLNVLIKANVQNQFFWLDDCNEIGCKYLYSQSKIFNDQVTNKNLKNESTLALCQKGKTHFVPHNLHHLRTILSLISQLHYLCIIGKEAN